MKSWKAADVLQHFQSTVQLEILNILEEIDISCQK